MTEMNKFYSTMVMALAVFLVVACEHKSETYNKYFDHQKEVAAAQHGKQTKPKRNVQAHNPTEPVKKDDDREKPSANQYGYNGSTPEQPEQPKPKPEQPKPQPEQPKPKPEQPKPQPQQSSQVTSPKNSPTVFYYDGIEYAYEKPTTSQLRDWAKKYNSTCKRKIAGKTGEYDIPQDMLSYHPCLVYLILNSQSMEDSDEKQSWFDLYSLMDQDQIDKLYDILYRERYKLSQIEEKYK